MTNYYAIVNEMFLPPHTGSADFPIFFIGCYNEAGEAVLGMTSPRSCCNGGGYSYSPDTHFGYSYSPDPHFDLRTNCIGKKNALKSMYITIKILLLIIFLSAIAMHTYLQKSNACLGYYIYSCIIIIIIQFFQSQYWQGMLTIIIILLSACSLCYVFYVNGALSLSHARGEVNSTHRVCLSVCQSVCQSVFQLLL